VIALKVVIFFSILILFHELGHFIAAKIMKVRVESFALGMGPKLLRFKGRETEYLICALPIGGYVKLSGETDEDKIEGKPWEFLSQPVGKRFWVIVMGPIMNFFLAFLIFSMMFFSLGSFSMTAEIGNVLDNFPAKESGILAGDKIVSIDDKTINNWQEVPNAIQSAKGESLKIIVERNKKLVTFSVKPKGKEIKDLLGKTSSMKIIGIEPKKIKLNFISSFIIGFQKTVILTVVTYKGLFLMLIGKISPNNIMGPAGIVAITGESAKQGLFAVFNLLGILSVNLAVVNLLPFPVLDGGHILFLGIEKIRRKRLNKKSQEVITAVGITLLVLLLVFATYNDFSRLGFWEKCSSFFNKIFKLSQK